MIERGKPDPFPVPGWSYATPQLESGNPPTISDELNMNRFVKGLEEADNVNAKNNAILRLVLILEDGKFHITNKDITFIKLLYVYSIGFKVIISFCY